MFYTKENCSNQNKCQHILSVMTSKLKAHTELVSIQVQQVVFAFSRSIIDNYKSGQ